MPNTSALPAFLYKLISKEHAFVIKEFPDWVKLWVNLLQTDENQVHISVRIC